MTRTIASFATRLTGHSLAALTLTLTLAAAQSPQLRIYQLDVEQADAALVISPNTNTLVIDTGLSGKSAERIKALMDKLGITKIDHLVTSHYHEDHFGDVPALLTNLNVSVVNAYDRGKEHVDHTGIFNAYEANLGHRAVALKPDDKINLDPAMTVTCIASSGRVRGGQNPAPSSDENDNSVALLIEFAGFRYFTGGDIERHTETNIAARHLVLNVDAYKASHHGSDTSSSLEIMGGPKTERDRHFQRRSRRFPSPDQSHSGPLRRDVSTA
jgi:competence protein ComEC